MPNTAVKLRPPRPSGNLPSECQPVKAVTVQSPSNGPEGPPAREGRHLPDRTALIRAVGAVLAEQNDGWTEARRYMGLDLLAEPTSPGPGSLHVRPHNQHAPEQARRKDLTESY
ncbi:hypothetical protein GCM10023083_41410 [Streptomyces phyllanthi]